MQIEFGMNWLLVLLFSTTSQAQVSPSQVLSYESFVNLVSQQHPESEIILLRLEKSRAAEDRTAQLPDPQISIGRDQIPLPDRFQQKQDEPVMTESVEEREAENGQWQVGLTQSFPWPGTLSAEKRVGTLQTELVALDVQRSLIERRFAASELFLRMVRVSKLIAIQKSNLSIVESIKDFAHAKFKQGIGSHLEFLATHSESGILRANIAGLETDLRNLKRHGMILLNDPSLAASSNPSALQLDLEWPSSLTATNDLPDLVREGIKREQNVLEARGESAYRRSLPSFMASGMLMQEDNSGMRMYGLTMGVSIPLYSMEQRRSLTRDSSITQNQIEKELAWHDQQKKLVITQIQDRINQIEATILALNTEIIPPVREHIEAATAEFSQGRADINAIIEGRRTLLNLQLTEVATLEALGLAKLSIDKAEAGFFAMELDQPSLQVAGGSAGMSGGSMGSGMSNNAPPGKRLVPSAKPSRQFLAPSTDDKEPQSDSSGMGM